MGAIIPSDEGNWVPAATGSYDTLWSTALQNVRTKWLSKLRGTFYIRFAHELNAGWFPWQVPADQITNFITAWQRFRGIQLSVFPEAKLVFCTNGQTANFAYDWRTLWPGDSYVDVYSTDWYAGNYKMSITTNKKLYDNYGGPIGLREHRQFAEDHGVPIAIPEWGVDHNAWGTGDDPNYIRYVYDFCAQYRGTGAGNLLYECYFNKTAGYESSDFQLFYPGQGNSTTNPLSSAAYRSLW